jgi:hypothetical protein
MAAGGDCSSAGIPGAEVGSNAALKAVVARSSFM